jgi:7,8-dihydroneopterin aldolase/epimerase/oxygenase
MRSIHLDRLRVQASIGILEHELLAKQPLLISICVDIDSADLLPEVDDVAAVLDYRHLRNAAIEQVEHGHINMLETLAGRIAANLLSHSVVSRVRVRVDKPSIFTDCDSVAVEVTAEQKKQD